MLFLLGLGVDTLQEQVWNSLAPGLSWVGWDRDTPMVEKALDPQESALPADFTPNGGSALMAMPAQPGRAQFLQRPRTLQREHGTNIPWKARTSAVLHYQRLQFKAAERCFPLLPSFQFRVWRFFSNSSPDPYSVIARNERWIGFSTVLCSRSARKHGQWQVNGSLTPINRPL